MANLTAETITTEQIDLPPRASTTSRISALCYTLDAVSALFRNERSFLPSMAYYYLAMALREQANGIEATSTALHELKRRAYEAADRLHDVSSLNLDR